VIGACAALVMAASALVVVFRFAPTGPPIYDGLCIDEVYRYLGHRPAPAAASQAFPGGESQPAQIATSESPPQAEVLLMLGSVVSRARFTVSVTPILAPPPPPSGQRFDGNAYRIVATSAGGGALQPSASAPATIVLRAATSGSHTILRLDGTRWTALQSSLEGCGNEYLASSTRLGVFAISEGRAQPNGGFPAALVALLSVAVLAGATLALLRLGRTRAEARGAKRPPSF